MTNYRYHHVHLISPEPLKTSEFYEKMFSARKTGVEQLDTGAIVNLELGGTFISIMPPRKQALIPTIGGTAYGIEHFGLKTDNLKQAVAELKAKGIIFAKDIIEPKPGFKTSFLVAPENVLIEIFENND
jgi:catechol 2,3-dioxygenase-like lactoylglutathione lyase family enzyme